MKDDRTYEQVLVAERKAAASKRPIAEKGLKAVRDGITRYLRKRQAKQKRQNNGKNKRTVKEQ